MLYNRKVKLLKICLLVGGSYNFANAADKILFPESKALIKTAPRHVDRPDPIRDNKLYHYPLQHKPYLFKITCPSTRPFTKPQKFYLLLTQHTFPLQFTIHPAKIRSIFNKCDAFIGELNPTNEGKGRSLEL